MAPADRRLPAAPPAERIGMIGYSRSSDVGLWLPTAFLAVEHGKTGTEDYPAVKALPARLGFKKGNSMEPWGFEPQIPPCHGGVIPFHYGPGIGQIVQPHFFVAGERVYPVINCCQAT